VLKIVRYWTSSTKASRLLSGMNLYGMWRSNTFSAWRVAINALMSCGVIIIEPLIPITSQRMELAEVLAFVWTITDEA